MIQRHVQGPSSPELDGQGYQYPGSVAIDRLYVEFDYVPRQACVGSRPDLQLAGELLNHVVKLDKGAYDHNISYCAG